MIKMKTSLCLSQCPTCGAELTFGSWPFCKGDPKDHETARTRRAQETPTVIFRSAEGKVWYPTGDLSQPPQGFEKVELRTTRERDKFEKEIGEQESVKLREHVYREREAWYATISEQDEGLKRLRDMSPGGRLFYDQIQKDIEKQEKRFDEKARGDVGFYIEGNHFYGKKHHDG